MATPFVDVLVPVALDHTYSYRVPRELELKPGDIVAVPLGAREAIGVVWADNVAIEPRLHNRMKDVELKLDYPPLKPELRKFVDWVSDYTLSPRGMVLRMCLRMGEHLGPAREKVGVRLAGPPPKRMTAARTRVLQLLADGMVRAKSEAAHEAGVSAGVIDGLIDEGALETLVLPPEPVARPPDPDHDVPEFTDAQRAAARRVARDRRASGGFSVTLVDGVTGSGKTEVYFEAVAEAIRRNKQVLILMPEIALTAQFLDRFAARFGVRPAEWHSELAPRKRARTWSAVAAGEVSVVVGARSALFLPYADLGLIVVDEEHDPAYKQEDGVRYHARDMAVVRARETKIPIVLASATPSVETVVNAQARPLRAPASAGAVRRPASALGRSDRSAARGPAARALHRAAACRSGEDRAGARRAGAAVPQPPRLCAADAVQRLRPPHGLPELRRLAGRSPLQAAARLPPLRLRDAAAGSSARNARRRAASSRSAPASSGWSRKRPSCFPARASWCCPAIWSTSIERMRAGTRRRRAGPLRHRDRHAACRQGPSFSQAQSGRHRRRRSRPRPTAIRAPPSARSSCCIRWSAAPAARRAAASAICKRISPSIR